MTTLAHWLYTLRPAMLARCAFAPAHSTPNNALTLSPLCLDDDQEQSRVLRELFACVVASSEGNTARVSQHLYILGAIAENEYPLHDLIGVIFRMQRVFRELLLAESLATVEVLALLEAFDAVTEQIVTHLTRERIGQADFIAASLAHATEEADLAALQLSALNEVSQQLSASLNVAQLLQLVGEKLGSLLDVDYISIWLRDTHGQLRCASAWGDTSVRLVDMLVASNDERDMVWRAVTTGRQLYDFAPVPDSQGAWYRPPCGVVVLPLLIKEQTTGVIVLQDRQPEQQLSRSQQNLARAVANQAATALENARLYEQIQHFNGELEQQVMARTSELQAERDRLSTLHDIALEVSSTLDLTSLLHNSLHALARVTDAQHGSVLLLEPDTGHLVTRAVLGQQIDVGFARFPVGAGIAGWVAQNKRPALVPDVQADSRWVSLPSGAASRKRQGALLAVPLAAQNELLGVITLSHPHIGAFNDDHLRLLAASAGEIAVGIHNANLYNDIVHEMEHSAELVHRLRHESSQNLAILQSLYDGVIVCDLDGVVLAVNPAVERIMQHNTVSLLTTNMHALLTMLAAPRAHELPLADLLKRPLDSQGQPRIFQSTLAIGMCTVSVTLGPVLTEHQELIGALALFHDISREVEADRLKTEFIGTMSHELRTPMTSIKGFTQLLSLGSLGALNDVQKESIDTIYFNAERMIGVINDVLDITKIEGNSFELDLRPLHLGEAVGNVVSGLHNAIRERGHTVTLHTAHDLPLVFAGAHRLQQILHHLIQNAIKYTPRNGDIRIEICPLPFELLPDAIRERLVSSKSYVRVDVRDTGVGIAPTDQSRVFERFYRTQNPLRVEAGGTGLGLSLVRPLVELLGGRIWLTSALNEGSTFSFVLPVV